eukprot:TCONS_00066748-protein
MLDYMMEVSEEFGTNVKRPAFSIDSILSQKMSEDSTTVAKLDDSLPTLTRRYSSADDSYTKCSCDKCDHGNNQFRVNLHGNSLADDFENRSFTTSPTRFNREDTDEDLNLKYSRYFNDIDDTSNRYSKRRRTIFTSSQLERLEYEFQQQQYIVGQERRFLARQLGLNEIQVKVWFQNRRIKWRKLTHGSIPSVIPELSL